MKKSFKTFLQNILHAVSVNVIRLLISIVLTLVLPRFLGIEMYSYWQLYLFYAMYIVYSSLGWSEGFYLEYVGQDFDKLNRREVSGQYWAQISYEGVISVIALSAVYFFVQDEIKRTILQLALLSAALDILRFSLQYLLQTTRRIKEYSWVAGSERILFFIFAVGCLIIGYRDFRLYIYAEIFARVISLLFAVWLCRKVLFIKPPKIKVILQKTKTFIANGIRLIAANFVSLLIIGVIRFSIEQHWGTVTFGKVSLALSISNIMIMSIAAAAIVIFPMLKRLDSQRHQGLYGIIRTIITVPIICVMVLYMPLNKILLLWLPKYADSLRYLGVLLPLCIFEIRSFVLTDTYFKLYKKLNTILFVNLLTLFISAIVTVVTIFMLEDMDMVIICIVLLLALKNILAEFFLRKQVGRFAAGDIGLEVGMAAIFIAANWFIGGWTATIIYLAAMIVYLLIKRKAIRMVIHKVKEIASA